jgi:hypothetical protein
MRNSGTAYYLYCLAPGGSGAPASAIGVDGRHAVLVHACGEIGAVCSEVELDEFRGEPAEARLRDLAWLGPRVCRHEAVIEEVMRQAPVLPARFATLFTSLDSLQRTVLAHREAITGFFAQLGGQHEWAVKGLLDRSGALERLVSSVESAPEARALDASPGARYFQEKRVQAQVERDFHLRLKEFCQRTAEALAAQAGGFRERKALAPLAEGTGAEAVLNWTFLLSPRALEDFRARLDRFNGGEGFPGLRLTLTGPWPPYSFAPDLSGGAKP